MLVTLQHHSHIRNSLLVLQCYPGLMRRPGDPWVLLARVGGDHRDPEPHFGGKRVQGRAVSFRKHLVPKQNRTGMAQK